MATLTIKGLANTDVVLTKINQDAYSGEYFKRVSNTEYRVKVRHTNETPKLGQLPVTRHNVEINVKTFSTEGGPTLEYTAYFVLRHPMAGDDTAFGYVIGNLSKFLESADITRLLGWDTDLVATES
jgi:hypothetical protein